MFVQCYDQSSKQCRHRMCSYFMHTLSCTCQETYCAVHVQEQEMNRTSLARKCCRAHLPYTYRPKDGRDEGYIVSW
ncbi:hypothetical protein Mapa_006089 [Marchantia paleacea]|nr:hypothetical protein Mapa_006089 [Marchantia paleacea]